MSTAIISSFDQLQPSLLALLIRAMAEDNRSELMSVSEELVDDEHEYANTTWNDVLVTHVLSGLCPTARFVPGLRGLESDRQAFDAVTGPPTCCDCCHQSLLHTINEQIFVQNPRTSPASSSVGGSSPALTVDFGMGDERMVAGPPGKLLKLAPDALLARLLPTGETLSFIVNHPNAGGDDFVSSQSIQMHSKADTAHPRGSVRIR